LKSEEKENDRRLGGESAMPIVRANVLAARLSLQIKPVIYQIENYSAVGPK
jgi:hypothetical protein